MADRCSSYHAADGTAQSVGVVFAGGTASGGVNSGDVDLHRGVVLGGNDGVRCRAVAKGHHRISKRSHTSGDRKDSGNAGSSS